MPSPFLRAAIKAGRALDRVFAETFTVVPRRLPPATVGGMVDVNARRQPDTSRQPFTFSGIFSLPSEEFHAMGRQRAQNTTRASNAPLPQIEADKTAWPYLPRQGDTIIRTETGERFTLSSELPPDDVGRTTLHLALQQGRAA